jgi:tryptophan halogenase
LVKNMSEAIGKVVIVGGGTAGWMTAASLARYFENKSAEVTVIDSSEIGTVGVGEATIPNIVDFNRNLGIDELEFIKATQATFKLGIKFENWYQKDTDFFHPFADYGVKLNNVDFHQYLQRMVSEGEEVNLQDYCFSSVLAQKENFAQPQPNPESPLADYQYAYHFDAGLYANYLKSFSLNLGIKHIDAKVESVQLNKKTGFIESLTLNNDQIISADLFIDCSGFKGLLIEEALETGYENWSDMLICDRAIAVQTNAVSTPTPYTRSIACDAGWQWRIPLQHRTGNGYIYSSQFESDEEAEKTLLNTIDGKPINSVRKFSFHPGRRKQIWNKNCVAIGLSSGFLEPLESTSISLIQSIIAKLLTFFPDKSFNEHDIAEVNRLHNAEVENIRDFLVLHYKLTQRSDTKFWQHCQQLTIPKTLAHKINLFESRGHIVMRENDSFEEASWLTMYNAFKCQAKRYDTRVDNYNINAIKANLQKMKTSIETAADQAMTHQQFINKHCKAKM